MKLYLVNNGLWHSCPELQFIIWNRYFRIKEYYKCDTCNFKFPNILAIGSKTQKIGNITRIGEITSYSLITFNYTFPNAPYIEL